MRLSRRREQALRRVEEVERVPGRRRVDDDEVEVRPRRAARAASPSPCTPACRRARRRRCGRSGCRGSAAPVPASAALRGDEHVERRLRVEHQRRRARPLGRAVAVVGPARRGRSRSASFGEVLEPERVGEPLGGVDRDDARVAAPARAFEREHRRGRGLADAAGAAAETTSCRRRRARRSMRFVTAASIPRVERVGEHVDLRRADVGGEEERQLDLRQRQPFARAVRSARAAARAARRGTRPRARGRRPRVRRRSGRTPRASSSIARPDRPTPAPGAARSTRSRPPARARRRPGPRSRTRCRRPRSPASPPAASRASPGSAPDRRAGSRRPAACLRIGPTRTASSSPRAERRNVTACPAAGASTMMRSAARELLDRLHLAEHEDVLHARARRSRPRRARPTRRGASRCASSRASRGSRRARRRA